MTMDIEKEAIILSDYRSLTPKEPLHVAPTAPMTLEQRLAQTEKILSELQTQIVKSRYVSDPIENLGTHIVVHGDINLSQFNLTQLPDLSLVIVEGHFDCSRNNLINLQGAPMKVTGRFNCAHNKLTSLKGAPKEVGAEFNCSHNKLSTLEYGPQNVGWFSTYSSEYDCSYNELITLLGAPKHLRSDFECSHNQLTSFKYAPEHIGKNLRGYNNPFDYYAVLAFSRSHLQEWTDRYASKNLTREEMEEKLPFVAESFQVSLAGSGEIIEKKDLRNPLRLAYKYGGIKGVMKVLTYNLIGGVVQTVPALPKPAAPAPASQTILIPAPALSPQEHFKAAMEGLDKLDHTQRAELVKEVLLLATDNFNDAASQAVIAAKHAQDNAEAILAAERAKLEKVIDAAQTSQSFLKSMFPNATDEFWAQLREAAQEDLAGKTSLRDGMLEAQIPPAP